MREKEGNLWIEGNESGSIEIGPTMESSRYRTNTYIRRIHCEYLNIGQLIYSLVIGMA